MLTVQCVSESTSARPVLHSMFLSVSCMEIWNSLLSLFYSIFHFSEETPRLPCNERNWTVTRTMKIKFQISNSLLNTMLFPSQVFTIQSWLLSRKNYSAATKTGGPGWAPLLWLHWPVSHTSTLSPVSGEIIHSQPGRGGGTFPLWPQVSFYENHIIGKKRPGYG